MKQAIENILRNDSIYELKDTSMKEAKESETESVM